jgi:hypothetical protein
MNGFSSSGPAREFVSAGAQPLQNFQNKNVSFYPMAPRMVKRRKHCRVHSRKIDARPLGARAAPFCVARLIYGNDKTAFEAAPGGFE